MVATAAVCLLGCGSADEGSSTVLSGGGFVDQQGHVSSIFDPQQRSSGKTPAQTLQDTSGRQIVFAPAAR